MIPTLYKTFQHWSDGCSVYLYSDPHFNDPDCKYMDPNWLPPEEQLDLINYIVKRPDTFICLGDVGDPEFARRIKAKRKVLILGNHDRRGDYKDVFDEIYEGPLFISDRILLSHEPVRGLSWCLNIHGHEHSGEKGPYYVGDCKFINLAANVCNYTPHSLKGIIRSGVLSDIKDIHRLAINRARNNAG